MAQNSSDRSTTLIFGAIFLFAVIRAALFVNMGAGLLLFLPTVGLPVYFFGRMFFLSLSEQGNRPPTPGEASQQTKRQDRESQVVLWVFFGGPVVLLCGAWLYNEGSTHPNGKPPPVPTFSTPINAAAVQTSQPTPTPSYWRPGVSLSMWYEDLLLERRDLDVKDPAAVQRFNAHVHEYDRALAESRRVPGLP